MCDPINQNTFGRGLGPDNLCTVKANESWCIQDGDKVTTNRLQKGRSVVVARPFVNMASSFVVSSLVHLKVLLADKGNRDRLLVPDV